MREKLGLTRLAKRPRQFEPTGVARRKKFFIFKDEGQSRWFVLIPSILRTFARSRESDWYVFETFEDARKWVSHQLT